MEAQTYPQIGDVVIAVSDDETGAAMGARRVRVIPNHGGSTPVGLNLALRESRGEVVVRCDAHAVLPADYVATAVETLVRTGADVVGGMQVPEGRTSWEKAIAAAMKSRWGAGDARYRIGGEAGPVETVYLGVFRRAALDRVGGFDEAFPRAQDYELNHRVIATGGVVWFDPDLRVDYLPRGSLRSLAHQYLQYGQAKRQFKRKHPGALRSRQLAPPALVLMLAGCLLGALWLPQLLAGIGAYALGLVGAGAASGYSPLRVAAALATMHLSWGAGFLVGHVGKPK